MPYDRFFGGKSVDRFAVNGTGGFPSGYGTTDFEAENIYRVLGRMPATDAEWAEVERVLGYTPGLKAGLQTAGYRRGEVLGPTGMMNTPDMSKWRR